MEELLRGLREAVDAEIWLAVLGSFEWVDWMTVTFFIAGFFYGMKKGFMRELALITEAAIAVYVAFEYYEKVAFFIGIYFPKIQPAHSKLIAYILSVSVISVALLLFDRLATRWLHTQLAAPLRVFGGAFLGAFHFLLLFGIVSYVLILTPIRSVQKMYEPGVSYTGHFIAKLVTRVHKIAATPLEYFGGS